MTVARALAVGTKLLQHTPSPELDAQVLLAHALKRDRAWLLAHGRDELPLAAALRFRWLVARRRRGVPVAYLTHEKEFFGRTFLVDRRVLIPRPETETLVEHVLETVRANASLDTVIDVGTGSGCIAITLACELPHIRVLATDSSAQALKVAHANAARHGVADRITFLRGNLLEPVHHLLSPRTLVVANPPYLLPSDISRDLRHEPREALDGGPDGLTLYRNMLEQFALLSRGTRPLCALYEVHPATEPRLRELIGNFLPNSTLHVYRDLAGLPRVVKLTLA